jgi:DNA-binding response OmpR family regulator
MADKKKVLIIDDSSTICAILETALSEKGFEVMVCRDAKCGIKSAEEVPPDIILLDLILPDLPGEEVCRQIKRNPQTENIPVVMLTAKSDEVDRVIGKVLGADAYIPKPFQMEELFERIQSLLLIAVFFFITLFSTFPLSAQQEDQGEVPPGMQVLKVGNTVILIPEGTKITDKGSQIVLEPPEQFWSRRVKDMEEEISRIREDQQKLKKDVQELKQIFNLTYNGPKN